MTLLDEILKVFAAEQVNLKDVPEGDPMAALGRQCETLFTGGVDTLRSIVPNDRIRTLARVIWDLVGHKRVLVVLGADVPSLSFTVMLRNTVHQGLVLIPKIWPQMVEHDPFMQLGAILFVGAQVVDFYNERLLDSTGRARWEAYEAELYRALVQMLPSWKPNEYQREILDLYPDGLDTLGVDLYAPPPFEQARGTA